MKFDPLLPAFVAATTTFTLFIIKDWLFAARQRRQYAVRLLVHCCRTLSKALELNPASLDIKASILDSTIDVYLKNSDLDIALASYLDVFFLWKSGIYMSATQNQIDEARRKLATAMDRIANA